MIITSWIERIGQSLTRSSRRKTDQRRDIALAGERLEERSLLSAQVFFSNGEIEVVLGPTDSVAVEESPVAPGTVVVLINGTPSTDFPIVATSAVTKLLITGGDDANLIDLTGITAAAFNNPALRIEAHGGNGADTLLGSDSLPDSLDGGHGADSIEGNGLNDTLLGDDGDDTINGGDGDDSIHAGDGQDVVDGGLGNDTINAGSGQDSVDGSAGADSISGDDGGDTLLGGDGIDIINGGQGNDSIDGQNDGDSIFGGAGNDTLLGGSGADSVDGQGGNDLEFAEAVNGQATVSTTLISSTVFTTNFDTGVPTQFSGITTTAGVQGYAGLGTAPNVFAMNLLQNDSGGTRGAPGSIPTSPTTLTLTNLPTHTSIDINFLLAIINSWNGLNAANFGMDFFNVSVDGTMLFHDSFDNVSATGVDQGYVAPPGVQITPRPLTDLGFPSPSTIFDSAWNLGLDPLFDNIPHTASTLTIDLFADGPGYEGSDSESWGIDNFEVILNGIPIITTAISNDTLLGSAGNDTVNGADGDDVLNGGAGDDVLDGRNGSDSIIGGSGGDSIVGGSGNDTVRGQAGNDTILGGGGADQLFGDAGNDQISGGEPQVSVDDVIVTEGNGGLNNAVFTLTLSFASQLPVTVTVNTSDGTATQGSDYTAAVNVPVTFAPGVTTQTISIPINTDVVIEPDETFFVNLSNGINVTIFDGLGQGTILDDDNPGPDVSIGLNFTGSTANDSGFIPPDTMGTVGPNHIVEMLNGVFAIYNKTTGAVLQRISLDQFWMSTGVAGPFGTFDSRIVFDPTSGRYFATAENVGPGPNGGGNSIFVGVSITSDPTAGFRGTRFVADSSGVAFDDYPTMSIDADGMYLATNNFGAATFDVSIFSIPKADLLLPIPSVANISRFEGLNPGLFGDSIQASLDFGPSDGRAALLSVGNGNLIRSTIVGAGGPGATLQAPTPIAVNPFQPAPDANQPGLGAPTIENVTPRFTGNVVEVGNSLWGTHTILDNVTGNSAIRWYEIDEVTNAVLQQGDFGDPTMDFLDPSIAVNAAGTVVIGATGSGTNAGEFASTFAFVGQTTAGITTFGPRMLLHAGTATYFQDFGSGRNRWGDYSATVVDPSNPTSFWTFQEFALDAVTWGIQITQLIVTPMAPPPPPPPPVVAIAGDTLTGGDGNDTLTGSEGDDVINGSGGNDSLDGGGGNDSITGGAGSDALDGSTGDDTLSGQGGPDTLIGGEGNDTFQWNIGDGDDVVSSQNGFDQMQVTGTGAVDTVSIRKLGPRIQVVSGGNVLTVNADIRLITLDLGNSDDLATVGDLSGVSLTVLSINGGDGNDTLDASAGVLGDVRLRLNGDAGNDRIIGSVNDDTIDGGLGRDTLLGGSGNDTLFGGADNDAVNGGSGDDSMTGDDGNDTLVGGDGNDTLRGGLGNDSLNGQAGADTIEGDEGRDTLLGGEGNDSLDAGDGKDFLTGGNGDDTLDGGRNDDTILGDAGADTIRGNHGHDLIDAGSGDDTVNGGDGNDAITGGDGNDLLAGADGNDIVNGAAGNDTLTGGDGNDSLAGGGGSDIVLGDDGEDTLNGNGGSNTLAGGQGSDSIFSLPTDIINENFVLSNDLLKKLDLL